MAEVNLILAMNRDCVFIDIESKFDKRRERLYFDIPRARILYFEQSHIK